MALTSIDVNVPDTGQETSASQVSASFVCLFLFLEGGLEGG